jgi:hypothetical protein
MQRRYTFLVRAAVFASLAASAHGGSLIWIDGWVRLAVDAQGQSYGPPAMGQFVGLVQTAFGGADNVTILRRDTFDFATLGDYDAMLMTVGNFSETLPGGQKTAIADFVASGKRTLLTGEWGTGGSGWTTWNNSLLPVLGAGITAFCRCSVPAPIPGPTGGGGTGVSVARYGTRPRPHPAPGAWGRASGRSLRPPWAASSGARPSSTSRSRPSSGPPRTLS